MRTVNTAVGSERVASLSASNSTRECYSKVLLESVSALNGSLEGLLESRWVVGRIQLQGYAVEVCYVAHYDKHISLCELLPMRPRL